jgi:hypothetical protein
VRGGDERSCVEESPELVENGRDMDVFVRVDPADHALGSSSLSVIMDVPPVLLKVEATSNGREGGQDTGWAWMHRRLFGYTLARPVASRSQHCAHRARQVSSWARSRADLRVRPGERSSVTNH